MFDAGTETAVVTAFVFDPAAGSFCDHVATAIDDEVAVATSAATDFAPLPCAAAEASARSARSREISFC
jgi:hypothetical protein